MWLVIFMVACLVPVFIYVGIILWRERQIDKENEREQAASQNA
jgi:hypothetical protein